MVLLVALLRVGGLKAVRGGAPAKPAATATPAALALSLLLVAITGALLLARAVARGRGHD